MLDKIWICHPNSDEHWSRKLVNHWLFKSSCECCHMWRLLIGGMLVALLPFALFAPFWVMIIHAICVAIFVGTGRWNKSQYQEPVVVATVKDEGAEK